jgi:MFS family permease
MAIGCFLTIIATFIQTFTPQYNIGVFIAGRVIIGLGQGIALSKPNCSDNITQPLMVFSIRTNLHRRACTS